MQMAQDAPDKLVVVIDDDPLILEAMSGLLGSWGFQVVAAATESMVLAQLAERGQRPDLIICDYRLADGRSGIDAIARFRAAFAVPAFLITAEAAPLRAGVVRSREFLVLHKPVSPATLRTKLCEALGLAKLPRAPG
jgi:CheY-like chemotaxis protein